MEGGSPAMIWERWSIPMYRAQQRYWADHPPVQWMVQAYLKIPFKKTPPPEAASEKPAEPMRPVDWSVLDE
jgi:hypothetical protein